MSFRLQKQYNTSDCGIACLQMICSHYGRQFSMHALSTICHTTNEGVSLLGIDEAASQLGFDTICKYSTINELLKVKQPCILHWNQNHFVVLYKIQNDKIYIADPAKGFVNYSIEEFKNHWLATTHNGIKKGVLMYLEPTDAFEEVTLYEGDNTQHIVKRLITYLKYYKTYLFQIIVGLFLTCLLQLALPFLTQNIVDLGISNKSVKLIWLILLGQFIVTLSCTSVDIIRRWLILHISMRVDISLISDFFIKLLKLPMSYFDTKVMGDLAQRIGDHSRINTFLTQNIISAIYSALIFVILGVALLFFNSLIFFVFLFGSFLYGCWGTYFLRHRRIIDYELFDIRAIQNNKTYEFLNSIQEIKLQNCVNRRRWEWEDVQADLYKVQMKSLRLQQIQEAGSTFINELKNITIIVISATSVINGSITLGMMLAIQYIIGQLNSPVEELMRFINSLQDVKISFERIDDINKKENEQNCNNGKKNFQNNSLEISLDDVCFKYNPHSLNNTINHVSINIPKGKITAIVGCSGSGKTTLVKLMLGYYPTTNGNIKIAGDDINEYDLKWWRSQCGVVMQNGVIFSESIARNIAIDDEKIDFERLEVAAEIANVKEFVMDLPLKYNTVVGRNGMDLSLGQKQRILIARAVYKNPSFIFLDEATNSLDANNERHIVENLNSFYKGRTVIIVAHRLSTVKNADQIIVLNKGKVVEIGNHESLVAKRGDYYELVRNQLEIDS